MNRLSVLLSALLLVAGMVCAAVPDGFVDLAKTDILRKAVEKTAQKWGDDNITSSGLEIKAFSIKLGAGDLDGQLKALTEKVLPILYKANEGEAFLAKGIETRVKPFQPEAVKMAAELASEDGFCYSPENKQDRKGVEKELSTALKGLTLSAADRVVISTVQVKQDDETRNLNLLPFFNAASKKAVYLYVRQGSM